MDAISFLSRMIELGKERAAASAGQMTSAFDSLNGFMGVYYELAKIFGRKGNGYIAVTSLEPAYWEPKDDAMFRALYGENWLEHYEKAGDYEYIAQGHANVWAVEMGSAAENGCFEAFMNGFASASLSGDTHCCTYQSPSQGTVTFGWNKPLTVAGEEITIQNYPRYDNAFAQTAFDADKIEISAGGHTTVLDFANVCRTDE